MSTPAIVYAYSGDDTERLYEMAPRELQLERRCAPIHERDVYTTPKSAFTHTRLVFKNSTHFPLRVTVLPNKRAGGAFRVGALETPVECFSSTLTLNGSSSGRPSFAGLHIFHNIPVAVKLIDDQGKKLCSTSQYLGCTELPASFTFSVKRKKSIPLIDNISGVIAPLASEIYLEKASVSRTDSEMSDEF